MPAFLRLVRFARVAALIAAAETIFCAVFIIGWQAKSWLANGTWPALRLSSVLKKLEIYRGDDIYMTASAGEIERSYLTKLWDALLGLPAIVPLLVASALLIAFYLWLTHTQKRYSEIECSGQRPQARHKIVPRLR